MKGIRITNINYNCLRKKKNYAKISRMQNNTHLDEGDKNDEERRRAAAVMVCIILPVPFLRKELVCDYTHHPRKQNIHVIY